MCLKHFNLLKCVARWVLILTLKITYWFSTEPCAWTISTFQNCRMLIVDLQIADLSQSRAFELCIFSQPDLTFNGSSSIRTVSQYGWARFIKCVAGWMSIFHFKNNLQVFHQAVHYFYLCCMSIFSNNLTIQCFSVGLEISFYSHRNCVSDFCLGRCWWIKVTKFFDFIFYLKLHRRLTPF